MVIVFIFCLFLCGVWLVKVRVVERERRVKDVIGDWREFLRIEVVKTL